MPTAPPQFPSFSDIRNKTEEKFGKRPCYLQIKVCDTILRRQKHVVCCASTGFGKTLAFMMPLLFSETSIVVVVTALNILGKQNVNALAAVGISAVAVSGKNNTDQTFKEIGDGRHRLVVVSPEILMEKNGHFDVLWKHKPFTEKLLTVVFDEAHCVSTWGGFRPDYKETGRLRHLLPTGIHFCLLSATLSPPVLKDIADVFNLTKANTEYLIRPNDRPNVFIAVRKMKYSAASFRDLNFLVPQVNGVGRVIDQKYIVFFDSIKEAEDCCKHLRARLPPGDQDCLIWFHSIMSDIYREEEAAAITIGLRKGAFGTDSIGMGVDIPDILLIIQWKLTCTMEALWQRFGRGARDPTLEAVAILFVEPKYFDNDDSVVVDIDDGPPRPKKRERTHSNVIEGERPAKKRAVQQTPAVNCDSTTTVPIPTLPSAQGSTLGGPERGYAHHDLDVKMHDAAQVVESEPVVKTEAPRASVAPGKPVQSVPTEEDLHRRYHVMEKVRNPRKSERAKAIEVDKALGDFVNAEARGFTCRRKIPRAYFGGINANDHERCIPYSPLGCTRCGPKASRLCCDLCTQNLLSILDIAVDAPDLEASIPALSHARSLIKGRAPTSVEKELGLKLRNWRDSTARTVLSRASYKNFGAEIFVSDNIINRLVLCCQVHKINSVADIARETLWKDTERYGATILQIIQDLYHPPAPVPPSHIPPSSGLPGSSPQQNLAVTAPQVIPRATRRPVTCSACGNQGHNARNMRCPSKLLSENLAPGEKENKAPLTSLTAGLSLASTSALAPPSLRMAPHASPMQIVASTSTAFLTTPVRPSGDAPLFVNSLFTSYRDCARPASLSMMTPQTRTPSHWQASTPAPQNSHAPSTPPPSVPSTSMLLREFTPPIAPTASLSQMPACLHVTGGQLPVAAIIPLSRSSWPFRSLES